MNNVHVPVRVCVGHLIYRHYEELPLCNRNIYMGQSPEQGPPFMLCPLTTDAWYRILLQEKCDVRMSGGSLYKASNDSYFNVPFILPGKQHMCGLSSYLLPSNQGLLSCQHQWAHGCWWASPLLTPRPASPLQPSAEVNVVCLENDSVPKDHANLVSDSPRVQPSSCSPEMRTLEGDEPGVGAEWKLYCSYRVRPAPHQLSDKPPRNSSSSSHDERRGKGRVKGVGTCNSNM